jgi:hypothetical protein
MTNKNKDYEEDVQYNIDDDTDIQEEFISQIDAVKPKKTRSRGKKVLFSAKDYYDCSMFVIKDFTENEESKFKGSDYVRVLSDMAKFFLANSQEETDTYKVEV